MKMTTGHTYPLRAFAPALVLVVLVLTTCALVLTNPDSVLGSVPASPAKGRTAPDAGTVVAHAPSLSEAHTAPHRLVLVPARDSVQHVVNQCPHGTWYSDVQAYSWRGAATSAQRWNRDRTLTWWRVRGGRVTFDGVRFANRSPRAVLVAGWCD